MLNKNTIIDLWRALEDTPFIERPDCEQILDAPDGFLGFPWGTEKRKIWDLFDRLYAPWGGITALLEDDPQPERKFQVDTPSGILEVYAKYEGDNPKDFPGVYIDLRYTKEQLRGDEVGDLVCCVEYDSCANRIQTCVYQPGRDEPTCVEVCEQPISYKDWLALHEKEITVLETYDCNGEEISPDVDIPAATLVVDWSQRSGDFSVELDCNLSDLVANTQTANSESQFKFNWDDFSATDFVDFCAKAENDQIEDGEYVGCVRVGELCFDLVVRSTHIEGRLVLDYDLYIGGVDSGYGYTKDGYPYDEGGGGSFGSLCIDMTYDDFKSHAKQVLGGFIHKENRKEKAMAPLRLW